ncbi:MAG: hypothetical protein ACR2K0_09000 [Acidimicrobiales bacterium]
MKQVLLGRQSRQGRVCADVGHAARWPLPARTAHHLAVSRPWHESFLTAMTSLAMALVGHKAIPANGTRRLKEAPT